MRIINMPEEEFKIIEKNLCSACKHSFDTYELDGRYENICLKKSKAVARDGGLTECTWWESK